MDSGLLARFWGFDKLLGSALVKIVYYVGLFGIGIWTLFLAFQALKLMGQVPSLGFGSLLMALALGAGGVVMWRFVCEMAILAFQTYNRLGEIRDRLPSNN